MRQRGLVFVILLGSACGRHLATSSLPLDTETTKLSSSDRCGPVKQHVYQQTSLGVVRGNGLCGGTDEFLGIPFGDSTRFGPSQLRTRPYDSLPFDAIDFGPACLQTLTPTTTYGVEDCLIVNVWTPNATRLESTGLPVLVYVYGGSNDFGEAEPYNASQLSVDQNVVVVSFNYRTGPLGFLAFPEEIAAGRSSGNYALLDIQTALRWVQREVGFFGGDANRLSLFGQSSGAGLVELQIVIPSSEGLLRGVISQSGGLGAQSLESAVNTTKEMARRLNCTERGFAEDDLLGCLRGVSGDEIIIAQGTQCITPNVCYGLSFGPVVDSILIPKSPKAMVEAGQILDIPIVLGANANDSNLMIIPAYPHGLNATQYAKAVRKELPHGSGEDVYQRAIALYPPSQNRQENVYSLGNIGTDRTFCSIRRLLSAISNIPSRTAPCFAYRFNHWFQSNEQCTAVSNYHPPELGAMHQDEVSFVFGQPIFMNLGYTNCSVPGWAGYSPTCEGCVFNAKELAFARTVGFFWSNVAASGSPNSRNDESSDSPWPRYTQDATNNILLEPSQAPYSPTTMVAEASFGREERCTFWDSLDS